MLGLMQEEELTLGRLLEHAAKWHAGTELVCRGADGTLARSTYRVACGRAKQVSNALLAAGIRPGDRVATLGWNSLAHLETWYGIVGIGVVCHTLNPRLLPEQIGFLVRHAEDRMIFADRACLPILEMILPLCPSVEAVVLFDESGAGALGSFSAVHNYEAWISGSSAECRWGTFVESTAAGLCYTSGTTGNPKGVLYSHRSNYLHALLTLQPDALCLSARDAVLLIVPMYHVNAWGVVFSAPMVGAKLVLPGQQLDGASIHALLENEGITFSAGVPTIWQMLLAHVRETNGRLSTLRRVSVGGSACPESIIREFRDRYDIEVIHGWGMTETSSLATASTPLRHMLGLPLEERLRYQLKQGRPVIGVDLKLTDDAGGRLPHDGKTPGRLKVKGATIARGYYGGEASDCMDTEGFFDTGDVATIDVHGYVQITDRLKDVIKSGGEWISSVDIENIAVGHPAAELCAVIGVPHPKWDERPLLLVKLKPGVSAREQEFIDHLSGRIAKWWMPDEIRFVDEIPLGPTGKIDKKALRARHATRPAKS